MKKYIDFLKLLNYKWYLPNITIFDDESGCIEVEDVIDHENSDLISLFEFKSIAELDTFIENYQKEEI